MLGYKHISNFTYHSASNGLVQINHGHLLGCLTCNSYPIKRTGNHPLDHVIHPHQFNCGVWIYTADMVFGVPLELYGEFFCDIANDIGPSLFVSHLQTYMKTNRVLPTHPTFRLTCISKDITEFHLCLFRCDYVK